MKPIQILFIVIVSFLIVGCSSLSTLNRPPVPANLMAHCAEIQPVQQPLDMGGLLAYSVEVTHMYGECSAKQRDLAQAVVIE